jgi:multiple sugar transport system substrate-binding protein
MADEGTRKFARMWQQILDQDLVADIPDWSDEWFQGLSDGSIASLVPPPPAVTPEILNECWK